MQFQIMAIVDPHKLFSKYKVPNFKNRRVCWSSAGTSEFEHLSFCVNKGLLVHN